MGWYERYQEPGERKVWVSIAGGTGRTLLTVKDCLALGSLRVNGDPVPPPVVRDELREYA